MLPSALKRCTCTSTSCLATPMVFAWTNWPEGRNMLLPPWGAGGDGRGGHARVGLARGAELGAGGEGKDVAGCVQAQRGDPAAAGEDLPAGAEAGVRGAVGVETSQRALNRREPDLALPGRAGHQD